jgi:hypothetical protein
VDSKRRKPKYRTYSRVRDAQNFARKLDVGEVDYDGRIDIANRCNYSLFLASQRGIPMPSAVVVHPRFAEEEDEDPSELAYYIHLGGAAGEIHVNAGHPAWDDIEAAMQEAREEHGFSTGDPHHPIVHELGELAMHQSVGPDPFDPMTEEYEAAEAKFRALGEEGTEASVLDQLADTVSDRAIANHSEFVAEVFAALMLGRDELRENQLVMDAYRRFGGERIVAWTAAGAD